jgi:hypothetical protein
MIDFATVLWRPFQIALLAPLSSGGKRKSILIGPCHSNVIVAAEIRVQSKSHGQNETRSP